MVRLTGETVDIMCKVNPSYIPFVTTEKGVPVLYMRLKKALYEYMQSAILWYDTFKDCLEGLGFKINPYDPCISNMKIDGSQCTICWYVHDNKISHKDLQIVAWVVLELEKKFGKMNVQRGNSMFLWG